MQRPRTKRVGGEQCAICACAVHHGGEYAKPTVGGRSHATKHHLVAERFFGRSLARPGKKRKGIFEECPWQLGEEERTKTFCYECHEELLHNVVMTPDVVEGFAALVRRRGLAEKRKPESRAKIGGRIKLLTTTRSRLVSQRSRGEAINWSRLGAI